MKKPDFLKLRVLSWVQAVVLPLCAALVPCLLIGRSTDKKNAGLWLGLTLTVFSVYLFLGFFLHWDSFYCALQLWKRQSMTPDKIDWDKTGKETRRIPLCCLALGVFMIVMWAIGKQ